MKAEIEEIRTLCNGKPFGAATRAYPPARPHLDRHGQSQAPTQINSGTTAGKRARLHTSKHAHPGIDILVHGHDGGVMHQLIDIFADGNGCITGHNG